jgi:integrase/recombinase XerD
VTRVAPTMEAFFTERLINQRGASPHTVASYRDSLRMLVSFAQRKTGVAPARLDFADLDAPLVGSFLDCLERERGLSVRSRNVRLAAVHSLFRFAALSHPEHAASIQRVLAIPQKRWEVNDVCFLNPDEVEALLGAPDRSSRTGRRDHALLVLAVQTGLRVSELTALRREDVRLGPAAHIISRGKGRKSRATPLTRSTARTVGAWLEEAPIDAAAPVFPGPRGAPLSRDAVRRAVSRHSSVAEGCCPSLRSKQVTPHTLRHTCAMSLLRAGVDIATIALWLGHERIETTLIYLHADLALKERALALAGPGPQAPAARRYRAPDSLMAFLDRLG